VSFGNLKPEGSSCPAYSILVMPLTVRAFYVIFYLLTSL